MSLDHCEFSSRKEKGKNVSQIFLPHADQGPKVPEKAFAHMGPKVPEKAYPSLPDQGPEVPETGLFLT